MAIFVKDPDSNLDYGFDWSGWLADGETISTSTWSVPAGLTAGASSHAGTGTTIWLSGGTEGNEYRVTNRIETSAGRIDERSHIIKVKER